VANIDWYFDFISPFAYFQFQRLRELEPYGQVSLKPVLFAGLLKHWEHKGPAEIPRKRRFTYRYALWYARQNGIKFTLPPAHPFPPLGLLRLAHAAGNSHAAVTAIFDYIWGEGHSPSDVQSFTALCQYLGIHEPAVTLAAGPVKQAVRAATDEAIQRGAFGVPTVFVDDELYWGVDATDMALAHFAAGAAFEDAQMRRAGTLPAEVTRAQVRI
jgi:2-hydroxychromene-2-carboxylate isomerase